MHSTGSYLPGDTMKHDWPEDDEEHVWGPWMTFSRTKYYRMCVHPHCGGVEYKDAPKEVPPE